LLNWQPKYKFKITEENNFHCCGLYLHSILKNEGYIYKKGEKVLEYDESMIYGWEDWDFWIKFHTKVGINFLIITGPMYLYDKSDNTYQHDLSSFCLRNFELCTSMLRLNNPCLYSINKLLSSANNIRENQQILKNDAFRWNLFKRKANSNNNSLAYKIKSLMEKNNDIKLLCPRKKDICPEIYNKIIKFNKHMFHMIISSYPKFETWLDITKHSIAAVLTLHKESKLIIHTNVENLLSPSFLNLFLDKIFIVPICNYFNAKIINLLETDKYMMKYGQGRPYFYSHFSDYYRFLVLYMYGGIYLDTDIILRYPVSEIKNSGSICYFYYTYSY